MSGLWRPDEVLSQKDLILPGVSPTNLVMGGRFETFSVTNDVYNICERLAELNPRLWIHGLRDINTDEVAFCIMEKTPRGDELVFKTRELDARIIEEVRYLMAVPLAKRVEQMDRILQEREQAAHEAELDKLYETMGEQFRYQLWHDGFIEHRDKSYPKRGVKAGD
jgi:hypothetical protein